MNFLRGNDIALHINPRFNEGGKQVLVRNHRQGERWGKEERTIQGPFPFAPGQPFEVSWDNGRGGRLFRCPLAKLARFLRGLWRGGMHARDKTPKRGPKGVLAKESLWVASRKLKR